MFFRSLNSRRRYEKYREKSKLKALEAKRKAKERSADPTAEHAKTKKGRTRSFLTLLREFLIMLRPHWASLAGALAALTLATLIGLIPPLGTKIVIDNALLGKPFNPSLPGIVLDTLPHEPAKLLAFVAIGMVSMAILGSLVSVWSRWQGTRITKRTQASVRRLVFDHAVRLPLHRVQELKSGGASSLLREDAGSVAELLFAMIYNPWRAIIQFTFTLLILTYTDWRMLAGALLLVPVVWMTHKTWIARIRPLFNDIRGTRQQVDGQVTEAFAGMRVVRSFARQRSEAMRFITGNHLMARQEILAWWWMRGIDIAWSIITPVSTAAMLWYGGSRILWDQQRVAAGTLDPSKALSVGAVVMFVTYLAWLLGPIEVLASSATQFQSSLSALDRVLDLIEEPSELPSRTGAIALVPAAVQGRITLKNVSFAYPQAKPLRLKSDEKKDENSDNHSKPKALPEKREVLHDVDLDVAPGTMVALVGRSGSGKTTLCNLVARFYDPTHGCVELDGVDLRDITLESHRGLLGIVEQDTFLFDGSIAQNIGYGRRDVTMDRIVEAAQLAHAHEFIVELPEGYETVIGERGVRLSGGQRQRLTIARALLADPRILILDEATSNLDTHSERLIQASLRTLMTGRTSFVIAHRLSTIAHADMIVVLEAGRIVERGRHDELMATSGRYRAMVELQTQPAQEAAEESAHGQPA